MILHYVIHLLIYSLAVYLVNKGIWLLYIKDLKTTILFSIVVGIGNTVIKPFFIILTFPITLITKENGKGKREKGVRTHILHPPSSVLHSPFSVLRLPSSVLHINNCRIFVYNEKNLTKKK